MEQQTAQKITNPLPGFLAVITLFSFQAAAGILGWAVSRLFDFTGLDPDHTFALLSVHHLTQMLFTLAVIAVLARFTHNNFGFQMGDQKTGWRYLLIFCAAIILIALIYHGVMLKLGRPITYQYALTPRNIAGTLAFQLLVTGPSEEILYRALPLTLLMVVFGKSNHLSQKLSVEVILSAVLFAAAHIPWSLVPLSAGVIDPSQLMYAFGMGILNGLVFQKTGSVLFPMLMHSISNAVMVGTGYVFSLLA